MVSDGKSQVSTPASKIIQKPPFERFVENLKAQAKLNAGMVSGSEIAEHIIGKVLEAETLEEAFAAQDAGMKNGKDLVDVEITVREFEFLPSDAKLADNSTLGVYARVVATDLSSGEEITFATGAPNVLTLLWKANQLDRLPLDCMIKAKDTANGQLLTLRLLPKRVVRG